MEVVWKSEILVNICQSTQCYNPEDKPSHTHHSEKLESQLHNCNILKFYQNTCKILDIIFVATLNFESQHLFLYDTPKAANGHNGMIHCLDLHEVWISCSDSKFFFFSCIMHTYCMAYNFLQWIRPFWRGNTYNQISSPAWMVLWQEGSNSMLL
jgi:hypothetical protein